jgi:RNA polymerase primary sigma factor
MVSIKEKVVLDNIPAEYRSIRYLADRLVKTRAAAQKAERVAERVADCGDSRSGNGCDKPGEFQLFAALHTCAYRATRSGRGRGVTETERVEWAARWKLIRDYLIDQNLGLAYSTLTRFQASHAEWDDLRSESFLALVRAVEGFNPWRGFRFSTYACHAIVRALVHASRKSTRYRLQFPAELETWREPAAQTDDWSELFVDRLRRALHENQGELTERETTVLAGRFPVGGGLGRTLSEIGDALGLSKERVRQIQNSALGKLREVLEADPALQ